MRLTVSGTFDCRNVKMMLWFFFVCLNCVYVLSKEEKCIGPNYKCKSIKECPSFLAKIHGTKEERLYVIEHHCGFIKKVPKVCCPIESKCVASALPDLDPNSQCCGIDGNMHHGWQHRVSRGVPTDIYQYTWLALIEYKKGENIRTPCSASIISNRYVLTAAHCTLKSQFGKPVSVRLGEYNTKTTEDFSDGINGNQIKYTTNSIQIERIIAHPDFVNGDTRKNDIALLRLASPIMFNDLIKPICLPSINITQHPPAIGLFLAGWGTEEVWGKQSHVKQHVRIPYRDIGVCESKLRRKFWEKQICAGGQDGKGDCTGDSGGPLMHHTGVKYEIVGIVSIGFRVCGLKPSVFTNVIEYLPWIKNNMHE